MKIRDLTDSELAKVLKEALKAYEGVYKDSAFQINPIKFTEMKNLSRMLRKVFSGSDHVDFKLNPYINAGYLTISGVLMKVTSRDMERFLKLISMCSSISMEPTSDEEICFSCVIPNIYDMISTNSDDDDDSKFE